MANVTDAYVIITVHLLKTIYPSPGIIPHITITTGWSVGKYHHHFACLSQLCHFLVSIWKPMLSAVFTFCPSQEIPRFSHYFYFYPGSKTHILIKRLWYQLEMFEVKSEDTEIYSNVTFLQYQGCHAPIKTKFPVFSLCSSLFPCVFSSTKK